MDARERVYRTLEFTRPDRAPRDLWLLPGVERYRQGEVEALLSRYPLDFNSPAVRYGVGQRASGTPNTVGKTFTDEWGCVWSVAEEGVVGEVTVPPLEDWSALARFTPPWEFLAIDFSRTNESCANDARFMKAGTYVRPFERMQFLRGTQNLLMDLAYLPPELYTLRDMVHEFFLREIELWAKTDVDGVSFMDDWGAQFNLLIDPALWRELFKPLYKDYCDILHGAGKQVFMHSDGHIASIVEDLVEIGVNALNCQLFCMDIEDLGQRFRGRLSFWGEICRQQVLPFGSPHDVREAVRRARRALDTGAGGVIAQCEWGLRDPRENIEAVFQAWLEDPP